MDTLAKRQLGQNSLCLPCQWGFIKKKKKISSGRANSFLFELAQFKKWFGVQESKQEVVKTVFLKKKMAENVSSVSILLNLICWQNNYIHDLISMIKTVQSIGSCSHLKGHLLEAATSISHHKILSYTAPVFSSHLSNKANSQQFQFPLIYVPSIYRSEEPKGHDWSSKLNKFQTEQPL